MGNPACQLTNRLHLLRLSKLILKRSRLLLGPLALGDVAPDAVVNGAPQDLGDLRRHEDVPDFTLPGAVTGFKIVPSFAHYFRDARPGSLRGFTFFEIGDAQPGKLLARITQLLAGRIVELQGPRRMGIKNHNPVGRMLE
jgi:hypothetical protein